MTVSNGLIKNNFSYATVMTMSSEVGFKTRYIYLLDKSILISRTKKRCPQILQDHHTMVKSSLDLLLAPINRSKNAKKIDVFSSKANLANLTGEMFGMKFRDRELPAPPLENNYSMESTTKKTSMETTTRKSSVETTSKTTSETVKKMQVLPPHLMSPHNLRANGRLPSCLEVQWDFFCKVRLFYFHMFSGVWAALVQTCG